MATTPRDLYPLSAPDAAPIPLEVVAPLSFIQWTLTAGIPQTIDIPAGKVAWIYATCNCILRMDSTVLPAAMVDATEYPNTMLVPANTMINLALTEGAAQLLGLSAGTFYMNIVVQWGAMNQVTQTTIG